MHMAASRVDEGGGGSIIVIGGGSVVRCLMNRNTIAYCTYDRDRGLIRSDRQRSGRTREQDMQEGIGSIFKRPGEFAPE